MQGQWGKLTGYFLGTLIVSAAITFGPPLLGGGSWLPDLITSEGESIDKLFWGLVIMSVVIFALVGCVVVYALFNFRAEPGDMGDGAHIHGNARMETAWIVIPSIIVFVIGVLSYQVLQENELGLYDKASANKKGAATMAVDVRAFSFGWAFRYRTTEGDPIGAEDLVSTELVVPEDEVIRFNVISCSGKERIGRERMQLSRELDAGDEEHHFAEIEPGICEREWDQTTDEDIEAAEDEVRQLREIRGKVDDGEDLTAEEQALLDEQPDFHGDAQYIDVNHAFWAPEARLKIDAVYGLRTYVQWTPTRVTDTDDRFQVVCAELCGSGHNGMRTDMCVVDEETFSWWTELGEETRGDATCDNLRLFPCIDDIDDRDDLLEDIATLTQEDPEATCAEAEEAAA